MGKKNKSKESSQTEEAIIEEKIATEQNMDNDEDGTSVDLQEELNREKDKFLRLYAEFENYKKRTVRERIEMFKTAGEDIMLALLPIMDDFGRALKELEKSDDDGLFKGVELIHNKLRETLKSKGLELMEVNPGDVFDAEVHEAVTQIPAPEEKFKGKVVDVVELGYRMGDKIIRYPKVVIGQ